MVKLVPALFLSISALIAFVEAKADPGACFLTVPKDPLTPHGLATPYILKKGNCDQTNPNQQVFVEATIFDPATKTFAVYQPLVINEGEDNSYSPCFCALTKNVISRNYDLSFVTG